MTTIDANAHLIFADARRMHDAALDRLASGDTRDAAEKAWCAALRYTEALVLAPTPNPPPSFPTPIGNPSPFLFLYPQRGFRSP